MNNKLNKLKVALATLGVCAIAITVIPSVYAQNNTTAPGLGQATGQELRAQGPNKINMKGKLGNFANLTLDEQKQKVAERIDQTIENLNERLQNMEENEFLTEDLKNQLQSLITNHLNNLPSYKEKVQAASDEDSLKAVLEEMHADGQAMQDFMKENRPTREQIQAQWESLSFDEKKAKMLENLNERQTELSERQTQLSETIQKVTDATTDEELAALRGAGMGGSQGMGKGMRMGEPGEGPERGGRMGRPGMGQGPIGDQE